MAAEPLTYTAYNPAPGLDPIFDGWLALYRARLSNADSEASFARRKLQDEYDRGIAQAKTGYGAQRGQLESSLLARGVGRSSEALDRFADLNASLTNQQTDAERARLEGLSTVDQELAKIYNDLAAERETQIGASRERLLARPDKPKVPDAETPGYVAPKPTVKPKPKAAKPKAKVAAKPKAKAKAKAKSSSSSSKPPDYYGYASQWA